MIENNSHFIFKTEGKNVYIARGHEEKNGKALSTLRSLNTFLEEQYTFYLMDYSIKPSTSILSIAQEIFDGYERRYQNQVNLPYQWMESCLNFVITTERSEILDLYNKIIKNYASKRTMNYVSERTMDNIKERAMLKIKEKLWSATYAEHGSPTNFPNELIFLIFSYLKVSELRKASLVCRNWYQILEVSDPLWKPFRIKAEKKLWKLEHPEIEPSELMIRDLEEHIDETLQQIDETLQQHVEEFTPSKLEKGITEKQAFIKARKDFWMNSWWAVLKKEHKAHKDFEDLIKWSNDLSISSLQFMAMAKDEEPM